MEITNLKKARKWFHDNMKPILTGAVKDSVVHDAVILKNGTILLTTKDGQYFRISLESGQK